MNELLVLNIGHYRLYTKLQVVPIGVNLTVEATSCHPVNDSKFDQMFFEEHGKEVKQKLLDLIKYG